MNKKKEQELAAEIERKKPTVCPKCGGKNITAFMVEWFTHSLDPCDIMNACILDEHQCHDCCISFWT